MNQEERDLVRIGDAVRFHGRAHIVEAIDQRAGGQIVAWLRYADRRPRATRKSLNRVPTAHPALLTMPWEVAR